jgi:hypothetical protein
MDLGSILLSLALFLLVAAFVARPLLDRASAANTSAAPADDLIAQREAILIELRDLDFDHETGKVSDDDYATQRARLIAKGVEILKALAAMSKPEHAAPASPASLDDEIEKAVAARRKTKVVLPPASLDDEIENAVAARRKSKAGPAPASLDDETEDVVAVSRRDFRDAASFAKFCPQCGTAAQPGDKFCAKCGAGLALAPEAA